MEFLPEKIDTYACQHTQRESSVLAQLNRETWAKVLIPRMLSGHLQGRALSMFSKMIRPKPFGIGTYTVTLLYACPIYKKKANFILLTLTKSYKLVVSFLKSRY